MPNHEIHERKKIKNYTILAILVLIIITFFSITIIKVDKANSNYKENLNNNVQE